MCELAIKLSERTSSEKSKKLRKNGQVPCILYGNRNETTRLIKANYLNLNKLLKTHSMGSIIKLNLNNEIINCIVKKVQRDIISGKVIHVDFQKVVKNEIVKMTIPIEFTGLKNLQSKRLVLETFITQIEMQGKVQEIPKHLNIDVSKMNSQDKIFVHDIALPQNIKLLTDEATLVSIVNSSQKIIPDDDTTEVAQ